MPLEIGSRQWGGAQYDIDFHIGRFDADRGEHDGPITFSVRAPNRSDDVVDRHAVKLAEAGLAILRTMRDARKDLSAPEIIERTSEFTSKILRNALAKHVDNRALITHVAPNPDPNARGAATTIVMYQLHPSLDRQ